MKDVSSSAVGCPHCGYPLLRKKVARTIGAKLRQLFTSIPTESETDAVLIDPAKVELLFSRMLPAAPHWSLTRINGIGFNMGKLKQVAYVGGKLVGVSRSYFTILFIPIIPIRWHVVRIEETSRAPIGLKYHTYAFCGAIDRKTYCEVFGG